jgi:hypothetical protein
MSRRRFLVAGAAALVSPALLGAYDVESGAEASASVLSPVLGMIQLFAGDYTPAGFLNCDGSSRKIANHPRLFSLLGTEYGGNGTTNFNLPNLNGTLPAGGKGLRYIIDSAGAFPQPAST